MPATDIEWTDRAWPVVNGCRHVSPGCSNCWAERLTATRLRHHPRYKGLAVYGAGGPRWTGERRLAVDLLDEPLRVREPQKWFVANKGDLFGEGVENDQIAAVYGIMALAPQHTFQVLTKRAERARDWYQWIANDGSVSDFAEGGAATALWTLVDYVDRPGHIITRATEKARKRGRLQWPPPNVWVGMSVEDQPRAEERIDLLAQVPAAVRYLSIEPLLGPVRLRRWLVQTACDNCSLGVMDADNAHLRGACTCSCHPRPPFDWVIIGGESGPGARPCDLAWIRSIVVECKAAGVPVFVKQLGARPVATYGEDWGGMKTLPKDRKGGDPEEWPEGLRIREWPLVVRLGARAG